MSFDLHFYCAPGSQPPTREQVGQAISQILASQATAAQSPAGTPIWQYKGAETGVTCRFDFNPAAADIHAGIDASGGGAPFSGLSVNVNYIRPRFVGIESLAAAGAVAGRLGLLMPDPRIPPRSGQPVNVVKTEPPTMNLMIEQWMAGNRFAIASAQKLTGNRPPFLDPDRSMYFWRFQRMRSGIQKAVGNSAIVPSSRIIRVASSGEVVLMTDWANGFPAVFPQAEVFLLIEAKSMNDPNAKAAWTPAGEVIDRLGPILRRFEQPGCDLIACSGVPQSGPMREAFNAIPRYPLAGAIEDIGLNFIDDPEVAPTSASASPPGPA